MFQSTQVSRDMMVSAPQALPSSAQALPCSLSAGWELIQNIPLHHKALDGDLLGGFSDIPINFDGEGFLAQRRSGLGGRCFADSASVLKV